MSPLTVLFVSAEYPPDPGGVGDYTSCLAEALRERGHRVVVLTAYNGQAQLVGASEARQSLGQALDWKWDTLRATRAAITTIQPDIVHVQFQAGAYCMHPAILALPSLLRRTSIQAPVVVTMHDLIVPYLFPKAGRVRSWALRRMMLAAGQVVVTNEIDFARLVEGRAGQAGAIPLYQGRALPPAQRPTLIPIGSNIAVEPPPDFDRDQWRSRHGFGPEMTLLAYFGLVSPSKGLDTVLDALALLPETVRLVVIGGEAGGPQDEAYLAALRSRIATPELRKRALITGYCDARDVSAYLLAADIGVLPFRDGASFRRGSLLAALAHALPTVTTFPQQRLSAPVARMPQLQHEQHALLIAPDKPAMLADAVTRLMHDGPLRHRIARGAIELAHHFGWPAIAAQHEQLYAGLTDGRHAATISVI